jgi:hypothetical protein
MQKVLLSAAVLLACGGVHAAASEDIALAKTAASAIELAAMTLPTAVRQGDMGDFRKYISGPVTAQMDAISNLPGPRRLNLIECTAAGNEFINRATDSMRAQSVNPAGSLEKTSLAACKALK